MFDYTYPTANNNIRSAPDLSWSQLCLVATFWVLYGIIIYAFTQPGVSEGVVNTFRFIAWSHGLVMAVCALSEAQDIDDARSHGLNSPQYIRMMTSRPLPTITVGVVDNGILFSVAISCFVAGFQFLGGVFLFKAFMSMALFAERRAYHASIGH